jgi:hypothetical protein
MEKFYFVRVTDKSGWTNEWVMLTKDQANHIYSEQVEKHGVHNTTTGRFHNGA